MDSSDAQNVRITSADPEPPGPRNRAPWAPGPKHWGSGSAFVFCVLRYILMFSSIRYVHILCISDSSSANPGAVVLQTPCAAQELYGIFLEPFFLEVWGEYV